MGILQTRIWLPEIPLSRFAARRNPGQKSGTGKSSGTRLENSSRLTGHAEVIPVNPTETLLGNLCMRSLAVLAKNRAFAVSQVFAILRSNAKRSAWKAIADSTTCSLRFSEDLNGGDGDRPTTLRLKNPCFGNSFP
jgi:hypothetical protein